MEATKSESLCSHAMTHLDDRELYDHRYDTTGSLESYTHLSLDNPRETGEGFRGLDLETPHD